MKNNKKNISLLLIIVVIIFLFKVNVNAKTKNIIEGNLFIHSTSSEFDVNDNILQNVEISDDIGDGAIVLKSDKLKGVYTSNIINTSPFEYLVLSWNSDTPEGTSIQIEAKVFEKKSKKWSEWLSFGTWGTFIKRESGTGVIDDSVAYVDTDTLVIKGDNGETANKIQYRVTLNTGTLGVTPSIRLISGAIRNTIPSQEIDKVFDYKLNLSNLEVLNVPQFSQMVRDPSIANSMCSATSLAMILNYYGTDILPEESAWGVYDYSYDGFGNWPFNTAYASSFGYKAYVDYSTIDGLKREIYNGHPVAVSVQYKNSESIKADLPVVTGAPIELNYGHLIVVCGFTEENGTEYVIINDPAASNNEGVRVKYKLSEFEEAWAEFGNIAYIIHEKEKGAGYGAPVKVDAKLEPQIAETTGKQKEYVLKYNDNIIDVSRDNVKTIMMTSDDSKTYQYITPSKKLTITDKSKEYLFITGEGKSYSAVIN